MSGAARPRPRRSRRLILGYAATAALLAASVALGTGGPAGSAQAAGVWPMSSGTPSPAGTGTDTASGTASPTDTITSTAAASTAPAPQPPIDPVSSPAPAPTTASPDPAGSSDPAGSPTSSSTITPSPDPSPSGSASVSPSPEPAPAGAGLLVAGVVGARTAAPGGPAAELAAAPLTGVAPFTSLTIRFALSNSGTDPVVLAPALQARAGSGTWEPVPDVATPGSPLHLTDAWVPRDGGLLAAPPVRDLPVAEETEPATAGLTLVPGLRISGELTEPLTLEPGTALEIEFTVGSSIDLAPDTLYEIRLTDAGAELNGPAPAAATTTIQSTPLAAAPEEPAPTFGLASAPQAATVLSDGQRTGADVTGPTEILSATTLSAATARSATTLAASATTTTLVVPTAAQPGATNINVVSGGQHGSGSVGGAACASCHSAHTAKTSLLLTAGGGQARTCFTCHAGTGADSNVEVQYALIRPADDPATRSFYSHSATGDAAHDQAGPEEMSGALNRHTVCSDCHNAHRASPETNAVQQSVAGAAIGWAPSSRMRGVGGVTVTNGAAGTTPVYTALDGIVQPVTLEYQLCFTCHSSWTTLPSGVDGKPSTDVTDVAVEFNPNNLSFHPVEAAGTNQTTAMAASLAGTSPYKMWNFATTDTVRCVNCHASSDVPASVTDPGSDLPLHTSANRSILLRPYRDRELKADTEAYAAEDSALCLVCHAEAPFANPTGPAIGDVTNFRLHGRHMRNIAGPGIAGTDIDTAGMGNGNALCAECHFRTHSTTDAVAGQAIDGSRLVNFAPNVTPVADGVPISWTRNDQGGGSCTLTCHGKVHDGIRYGG